MGGWFLERIKSIAVFMLCAQCLLHFAPGERYGKYIKLLAGMMVLAQILIPLGGLFPQEERMDMEREVESFRQELDKAMEEIPDRFLMESGESGEEGEPFVTSLEEELRERLERTAALYGCHVERVKLKLPVQEEPGGQAAVESLIVTVSPLEGGRDASAEIQPVRVEEIHIGEPDREESGGGKRIDEPRGEELREAFSEELGMEEGGIEVVF